MDTPSAPIPPASRADDLTLTARFLGRLEQRAAALYGVWAVVAALAHGLGAVPLPPGAGLILATGCALTVALFIAVGRLPAADQPGGPMLVAAQSLVGLAWSTLYAWYAAGSAGGGVLSAGMYLTVIALALPAASLPAVKRLMIGAVAASVLVPVVHRGVSAVASPLVESLLASLVLAVLLGAIYLAARTLAAARDELQARNAELQAGIERITRRSERDHLTNSYNRESILEMVGREKSRADRSGDVLCICLLDIDHFKSMNDRFGHQAGDRILAAFARRVRSALRTMDTVNSADLTVTPLPAATDRRVRAAGIRSAFGRVGGEEFIVLLPETSLRGALKCAERVRKAVVRRPFDELHQVTVSIGIAEYRPGETVSSLVGRADEALYGAKNAGRNRVHCATTDGGPNAIVMPSFLEGTGP